MRRSVRLRKVRFDAGAREAIKAAEQMAAARGRLSFGLHHLVAGAMTAPGVGRDTLTGQGVAPDHLVEAFDAVSGESVQLVASTPTPAASVSLVMDRAIDTARADGAAAADLGCLLLTALRAGSPLVAVAIGRVGIDVVALQGGLGVASVDLTLPPGAPPVFARYSAETRRVVVVAKFVAIHLGSASIEPLHLALALAGEESQASRVMQAAGLDVRAIWSAIDPAGSHPPFRFDLLPLGESSHGISPMCRQAMEAAGGPADRSGSLSVEPQHLALALLDQRIPELEACLVRGRVDLQLLRAWLIA